MLTTLVQIAPLISCIALVAGVIGAWTTLLVVQRRTLHMQWDDAFREVYSDFWKDENISKARRRVDNDNEFAELHKVISKLFSDERVEMSPDDYVLLEDLDRFCAILLRAAFFSRQRMTRAQREQWTAMFESYWINRLYERPGLKAYVERFWPPLFKLTYSRRVHLSFFQSKTVPEGGLQKS